MSSVVAVIVDVVGSRQLRDRDRAQSDILAAFGAADRRVQPLTSAWATFADEFQAVYSGVRQAAAATGIVRLSLSEGVDVRFGVGVGNSREISAGSSGPVLDGSAWWNARAAIETAERDGARSGSTRSWVVDPESGVADINSALLLRDQLISAMNARERRIASALLLGATQVEIADREGVSQSAVSQAARKSGAHVLAQVTDLWLDPKE